MGFKGKKICSMNEVRPIQGTETHSEEQVYSTFKTVWNITATIIGAAILFLAGWGVLLLISRMFEILGI